MLDVLALASTADVVDRVHDSALALVLHESADRRLVDQEVPARGDVVLVVGPEGGLSDPELEALGAAGGVPVRLGPAVLRTSTAGAVAAALVAVRADRWS